MCGDETPAHFLAGIKAQAGRTVFVLFSLLRDIAAFARTSEFVSVRALDNGSKALVSFSMPRDLAAFSRTSGDVSLEL